MRLSDIIEHISRIFEKKRKNPVQLDNDSNLESNLKFLKVDKENTPIQISDDTVNVQGSLTVNGTSVSTEPDVGAITALNSATENELVTVGATTTELDAEANLTFDGDHLSIAALGRIGFDGSGGHTHITESADDILDFYVGTDKMLSLDEANDKIIMGATNWVAGTVSAGTVTEFSAANSAYAGMILGYTSLLNDAADDSYAVTASFVTIDADTKITFVAPPSGNVEISTSMYIVSTATRQFSL